MTSPDILAFADKMSCRCNKKMQITNSYTINDQGFSYFYNNFSCMHNDCNYSIQIVKNNINNEIYLLKELLHIHIYPNMYIINNRFREDLYFNGNPNIVETKYKNKSVYDVYVMNWDLKQNDGKIMNKINLLQLFG